MPSPISHFKQLFRPTGIIVLLLGTTMALPSLAAEAANKDNTKKIVDGALNLSQEIAKVSSKYILTEDKLERLIKIKEDIVAMAKELDKYHPSDAMPTSIDDIAKNFDINPIAHKILANHGFTAREYIIATMTLDSSASEITNPNTIPAAAINPKNIEFVRKHQAKIDKYLKSPNADE